MGMLEGKVAIITGSGRGIGAAAASYSTGKAGIVGLTKTLAKEWGRYNVQVNCVCFGFIETRMTAPKEGAEKLQREGEELELKRTGGMQTWT